MTTDTYISDEMRSALSAAIWNYFLYELDGFTFNGSMAREATLADADEIAAIALEAIAPALVRKGMERAAKVAAGNYSNESKYDQNSPHYGIDLNPDRSDFGRGKQAGRSEAAAAIRTAAEEV